MSKLSVPQAAERLGVSPARIRQRIKDGSLVAEKIGGRWLVDLEGSRPQHAQLGRPVSPSAVWWSLASAEVAKVAVPILAASSALSEVQKAMRPVIDADVSPKADVFLKAVASALDVSAFRAAVKPAIDSATLSRSLLPRMRLAELVLADLAEASISKPDDDEVAVGAESRGEQLDFMAPGFVAEAKKLSRSSRDRAVHRFAGAVQDGDHNKLLAWLSNRGARIGYVAAGSDLAALRADDRLLVSGVSHPDSNLDDPRIVEAYASVDDVDAVVSDFWLEKPGVDERSNVVLHVVPVRPPEIGPLLLAADLAEHGGPREVQRAHELLSVAMNTLVSAEGNKQAPPDRALP